MHGSVWASCVGNVRSSFLGIRDDKEVDATRLQIIISNFACK